MRIIGIDPGLARVGYGVIDVDNTHQDMIDCGIICTDSSQKEGERMVEIATKMRATTDKFLVVQSNAGLPVIRGGETCYLETPEFMSKHYRRLADLPINILGGCCGTTSEHISSLVQSVKAR